MKQTKISLTGSGINNKLTWRQHSRNSIAVSSARNYSATISLQPMRFLKILECIIASNHILSLFGILHPRSLFILSHFQYGFRYSLPRIHIEHIVPYIYYLTRTSPSPSGFYPIISHSFTHLLASYGPLIPKSTT